MMGRISSLLNMNLSLVLAPSASIITASRYSDKNPQGGITGSSSHLFKTYGSQ